MKEYLGDGVYAEISPDHLILTTENGIETTNTIYLEPEVLTMLVDFLDRAKKKKPCQEGTHDWMCGHPGYLPLHVCKCTKCDLPHLT